MTRSIKNSRKIVVNGVEYRWRARGDDGYIALIIWPSNNIGPAITSGFLYHQTWVEVPGGHSSMGDQIVITNRLVRRAIDFAITVHGYDPTIPGDDLGFSGEENIDWSDAVRANDLQHCM
jgi:hypothetical protein